MIAMGKGDGQRGFTLVELVVALGIVALGLALAVPSFNRARAGLTLRNAAYALAANLRDARTAAQAGNVEHALVLDLGRRQYWVEGVVAPRGLPPALAVELTVPQSERLGEAAGRVRFLPDGASSGARIVLNDGKATASVSVDWLSGDVRVHLGR
jgi:general secretion pathway protein H